MGLFGFGKKKKEEKKEEEEAGEEEGEEAKEKAPAIDPNANLATQVEQIKIELTKINATLDAFKEINKSTAERFSTVNEQIGEIRGQVMDSNRAMGKLEVKATKAADLVESVHPDKLMIEVQKQDGKIEGVRSLIESHEEMVKNVMDQLKKLRNELSVFKGVEQVVKMSEEVKDEIMAMKRVTAMVERHADRVENIYAEAQKSFNAFNQFSDRLDTMKADLAEQQQKIDKIDAKVATFMKKEEIEKKLNKFEKDDKHRKKVLDDIEKSYKQLDEKFEQLKAELKGAFDRRIYKAEVLSGAFEKFLADNPDLVKGLDLTKFLEKYGGEEKKEEKKEESGEGEKKEGEEGQSKEEAKEGEESGESAEGEGEEKKEG
ncbi:MAG: hypothetical protein D6797_05730 [Bdellovibrio sp.]|nr:MAG: hypothetical protein D6797_05730 [Bdellovibrio sp.]